MQDELPLLIPGFHGVRLTLSQGKVAILELWIAEGKKPARIEEIIRMAKEKNIPISFKKRTELDCLFPGIAHQGIVALAEKFVYADPDQLINTSLQDQGRALIIAADHITDEGNLGALIRSASFFGAHGLIIPKDRSAKVTAGVLKRSSGACASLPIVKVVNMGRTMDLLAKKGFWIIGASGESPNSIYGFDWNRDLVLILGNERRGLSSGVRRRCHHVVSVPSVGDAESLNIAVAGGVILSEIVRQRKTLQGPY